MVRTNNISFKNDELVLTLHACNNLKRLLVEEGQKDQVVVIERAIEKLEVQVEHREQ